MEKLKKRLQDGHAVDEKGYFESYRGNIFRGRMSIEFQDMFNAGSGDELRTKAEAVHSSSMLSYNFFHWIKEKNLFKWENVEYNKVLFEVKMQTIIGSPAPANMDVVLISKDKKHLLFIESKFLEYTEAKSFKLSESYYQDEKRFIKKDDVDWEKLLYNHDSEEYKPDGCYKYKEGIKQLITHLFGIHGLVYDNNKTRSYAKEHCDTLKEVFNSKQQIDFKFITLIFKPNKDEFREEYGSYEEYKGLFKLFVDRIKDEKVRGLQVIPQWVSYSTMWKEMKDQIKEKELRAFLWERYMRFAEGTEE